MCPAPPCATIDSLKLFEREQCTSCNQTGFNNLCSGSIDFKANCCVKAKFFDCDIEFLVDTVSNISVLSKDFVRCNSLETILAPTEHTVCVADGWEVAYS